MTTKPTAAVNPKWIVEAGYEPVRDAFVKGQGSFGFGGGAYCAYIDGRPVVDLWGGNAKPGQPWDDTATVLMSATKGFASMCLQLLVDRGQLEMNDTVATYWPEYAQNGKQATSVRELDVAHRRGGGIRPDARGDPSRRHRMGRPRRDRSPPRRVGTVVHSWNQAHLPCAVDRLAGRPTCARRIDGRTLGRFFAEEIAGPLSLDAWIGLPDDQRSRVAHIYPIRLDYLPKPLRLAQEAMLAAARDPDKLIGRAFIGDGTASPLDFVERLFNDPGFQACEVPAGNGIATARATARCWAMMANGGELDGTRVLSADVVDEWSRVIAKEPDIAFGQIDGGRLLAQLAKVQIPRDYRPSRQR